MEENYNFIENNLEVSKEIRTFAPSNKKLNQLNTIMKKKYILTDETITHNGHVLHRIKALRDFGEVNEGELGGWIEKEENLSHYGKCWVGGEARVYDNANVIGNSLVYGDAKVYDNAKMQDNVEVYGNAYIYGNAWLHGNPKVHANTYVHGNALVCGDAEVCGNADVCENAKVYGEAVVCGYAKVNGNAYIFGNAKVYGHALVSDNVHVYENAEVFGDAWVMGGARIGGDAVIETHKDYIVFKNNWSSGRFFTWTRSNDMWSVGCFYGTGKELIEKAYRDSEDSGKRYEATVNYVELLKKI